MRFLLSTLAALLPGLNVHAVRIRWRAEFRAASKPRADSDSSSCRVWKGWLSPEDAGYHAWYSNAWGNLLSEYWEARAAALLAGVPYQGDEFPPNLKGDVTWLSYLPAVSSPDPALKNLTALRAMCRDCADEMFPHACAGKWTRIRKTIINDTQAAVTTFATAFNLSLPSFGPHDVLVHLRSEPSHPQVEWPGRSYFQGLIPSDTKTIFFVHEDKPMFRPIVDMYTNLLGEVCGGCHVESVSGSQFEDFARMTQAPLVFCGFSTYCLWSAMGNPGTVYMPDSFAGGLRPPIDDKWHWVAGQRLKNADRPAKISDEKWIQEVVRQVPQL
eukprot:gnl/TRDRNA2_/TRDRNA2_186337_c0_seq1.p1 gnl/TRDRNA2_/TRDRNA2_186337_c0~~gnl/TRDRNA2_/TRDRNA2_186337_c0_seq1.p1  ORF type:complete len:328 (+),score=38.93 gnl/TRDRNA2_/TRDRNA2_186337_c0_seq1:129-1112(+)